MPEPIQYTSQTREVKDIHADWWSPKRTTDGNFHSPEAAEDEAGRYVERVVIYAEMFGADTTAIQTRSLRNVNLQRIGEPKSAAEIARARLYAFQRMVVEVTNKMGQPIFITDDFMAHTPERDLAFMEQEITKLSQSPVEVTPDEQAQFERNAECYDELAAEGYPGHLRELKSPDELAQDNFRRNS